MKAKTRVKKTAAERIPVNWTFGNPSDVIHTFQFDPAKSWKGQLVRGYDIAEVIAYELWETEAMTVGKIHITAPEKFVGTYEIQTKFEPSFSAKRVDISRNLVINKQGFPSK